MWTCAAGGGTEGRHFRSVTRLSISESSGVQFGLWSWASAETMHLSQIPCLRLLALDTRFDSAFMCKECVTVSAQKISLLRTKSPMRLLHWRAGRFTRVKCVSAAGESCLLKYSWVYCWI